MRKASIPEEYKPKMVNNNEYTETELQEPFANQDKATHAMTMEDAKDSQFKQDKHTKVSHMNNDERTLNHYCLPSTQQAIAASEQIKPTIKVVGLASTNHGLEPAHDDNTMTVIVTTKNAASEEINKAAAGDDDTAPTKITRQHSKVLGLRRSPQLDINAPTTTQLTSTSKHQHTISPTTISPTHTNNITDTNH
eukprot:CAMPEP_0172484312 /NCGR_PEP_ID=MMETSP1066-20121228/11713_1 /TAXON_ID=671091 /ORGANISM="Coscinodiscus wailesii, Strain CCMP2513" /LENGTH=193 /DNA_ID=CAMNT_0013248729 /DNA_START=2796 /DNA_END=3377 /DNA_ORIENTATION=+